jgi:hypothetical protein
MGAGSLNAAIDSDRFLRAAPLRLKQLRDDLTAILSSVDRRLSVVEGQFEFSAIGRVRRQLATISIADRKLLRSPTAGVPDWARESEQTPKENVPDLSVALVEFKINGTTAENVQALRARENLDLDIAVRVSRWPETATSLVLSQRTLRFDSSVGNRQAITG